MNFYYDFNQKKQVNPLDTITHFFINPYMPQGFRDLNLDHKVADNEVDTTLVIQESTRLPILIMPIELLDLSVARVKIEDNGNMIISAGKKRIYVKPTQQAHLVRIDSVLF